ncbi:hypothetical protein MHYP_G00322810 [Metynnis hypsauchen]
MGARPTPQATRGSPGCLTQIYAIMIRPPPESLHATLTLAIHHRATVITPERRPYTLHHVPVLAQELSMHNASREGEQGSIALLSFFPSFISCSASSPHSPSLTRAFLLDTCPCHPSPPPTAALDGKQWAPKHIHSSEQREEESYLKQSQPSQASMWAHPGESPAILERSSCHRV